MKSKDAAVLVAVVSALAGIIVNVLALAASKTISNLGNFVWILFLFLASITLSIILLSNVRQVLGLIIKLYQLALKYIENKTPRAGHKEMTPFLGAESNWIGGIITLFIVAILLSQLINDFLLRFLSSFFR